MTFVDTSFLFAGFDPRDDRHHDACALSERTHDDRLVTTNHVVGELWTLARRRESHAAAVSVVERLTHESPRIDVAHVDADLEREALAWLRRHDEREYSYVDATSFAYMRRNGITDALAFDGDFAAAGFIELRPQRPS